MIYCNECKSEFEPKVRTKQLDKDTEEVFFNCPECNERYTAYYLNDKIKDMQKKLVYQARRNGKHILVEKLQEDMLNEFNRLEEIYSTQ